MRDVLLVDRDLPVGGVLEHDLADVLACCVGVFVSAGRLMSTPFCVERQRRHEDDEQHEQHVDERRDVHVRTGVRHLALDDLVGAEVLMRVRHYLPSRRRVGVLLGLGDEADVLDPGLAQLRPSPP